MRSVFLFCLLAFSGSLFAQTDTTGKRESIKPLQEDSTALVKIIPAELPKAVQDTLLKMNYQLGDVFTAHKNNAGSMFVVEIAHDLVRETFWFDPKGIKLRPSVRKIH